MNENLVNGNTRRPRLLPPSLFRPISPKQWKGLLVNQAQLPLSLKQACSSLPWAFLRGYFSFTLSYTKISFSFHCLYSLNNIWNPPLLSPLYFRKVFIAKALMDLFRCACSSASNHICIVIYIRKFQNSKWGKFQWRTREGTVIDVVIRGGVDAVIFRSCLYQWITWPKKL